MAKPITIPAVKKPKGYTEGEYKIVYYYKTTNPPKTYFWGMIKISTCFCATTVNIPPAATKEKGKDDSVKTIPRFVSLTNYPFIQESVYFIPHWGREYLFFYGIKRF